MTWTKLPVDILSWESVQKLLKEKGLKGFAVYIILRLFAAINEVNGGSLESLVKYGTSFTSKRLVMEIIEDYGLFVVNDGIVSCNDSSCASVHAPDPAGDPASAPADDPASDPAGVPTKDKNRKDKNKENIKEGYLFGQSPEEKWAKGFKEHYPRLAKLKQPLTELQYRKLRKLGHSRDDIVNKLLKMENYSKINTHVSVYLTLLDWLPKK